MLARLLILVAAPIAGVLGSYAHLPESGKGLAPKITVTFYKYSDCLSLDTIPNQDSVTVECSSKLVDVNGASKIGDGVLPAACIQGEFKSFQVGDYYTADKEFSAIVVQEHSNSCKMATNAEGKVQKTYTPPNEGKVACHNIVTERQATRSANANAPHLPAGKSNTIQCLYQTRKDKSVW